MKRKLIIIPALLVTVLLFVQGCTASNNSPAATPVAETTAAPVQTSVPEPTATAAESAELVLTLDELAQYNGQNGNPAYIAVDGVIYDVTDVPQWKGGFHNGFTAGQDLTEEIKTISPHGVSKLQLVKAVGKLAD